MSSCTIFGKLAEKWRQRLILAVSHLSGRIFNCYGPILENDFNTWSTGILLIYLNVSLYLWNASSCKHLVSWAKLLRIVFFHANFIFSSTASSSASFYKKKHPDLIFEYQIFFFVLHSKEFCMTAFYWGVMGG